MSEDINGTEEPKMRTKCESCKGTGIWAGKTKCIACNGTGKFQEIPKPGK